MPYNFCAMNRPNDITDQQLNFRLGRMAGCLERLLVPNFPSDQLSWLVRRTLGTDIRFQGSELLPLTRFRTEDQASAVWERVAIELDERGVGPGNVRTDVDAIFEELALNAAQHSQAQDSCYGVVEVDSRRRLPSLRRNEGEILYVVGLSDGGIGIPSSLRQNPLYTGIANDKDAILKATDMDVTGTDQPRGAGLHHVMERVRAYRGELLIISGYGFLRVSRGDDAAVDDLSSEGDLYHYGTVVLAALPVPALENT